MVEVRGIDAHHLSFLHRGLCPLLADGKPFCHPWIGKSLRSMWGTTCSPTPSRMDRGSISHLSTKIDNILRCCPLFLVEVRGIEPLSILLSTVVSPSAVCAFLFPSINSRKQDFISSSFMNTY